MQDNDSLINCVGVLINWLQPSVVVMLSSSRPAVLSLLVVHHFKRFALKSPVAIEKARR